MADDNPTPEPESTPEIPPTPPAEPPAPPVPTEPPAPGAPEAPTTPGGSPPAPAPPTPPIQAQAPAQGPDDTAEREATARAEKAEAELTELRAQLEREAAGRRYGIPENLIPLLRPGHADEDAKALASHAPAGTGPLGVGGLDPTTQPDPSAEGERLAASLRTRFDFTR
ncbi:hypothetical protein ACIP5N_27755 [Streptomyces sp. NPDC088768]|uniref:hypothetical protein n=1 Tax=Streptomyces sp. NPDC088768 TaxID=3365894 RepID=UPI00382D0019